MIKRLLASAAAVALPLSFALAGSAQAAPLTGACDDSEGHYDWSIANPARYQAEAHEAVVGLSDARRTVTLTAPVGCLDEGDTWRVYNGYFSAEGTISADDAAAHKDSDSVLVEVPSSNSVAGDEINVKIKINDDESAAGTGYEINQSSADSPLVLLRRTEFKYKTTPNRINFSEPYNADTNVIGTGNLIRASWTSKSYVGYEGRNVHAQTRLDAGAYGAPVDSVVTGSGGSVRFSIDIPGDYDPVGAPFIARGLYRGNGTSSGTWSQGDRIEPAA